MNMKIIIKLCDLHKQATTEQSHYYVASTVKEAIDEIETLQERVDELEQTLKETALKLVKFAKDNIVA